PADIDRIDELKSQLERAKEELAATRRMVEQGGLPVKIRPYLRERSLEPRSFDLCIEVPEPPMEQEEVFQAGTSKRTGARLLTDEERGALPEGVIFTVDGQPVTKAEYDAAHGYFAAKPGI